MSLATVCGVENIISLFSYNSFLNSGFTSPVKISIFASMCFLNVFLCCATKGFDGAKNNILEFLKLFNLLTANIIAIEVFPNPVGNTTSVFLVNEVLTMFSWYSLGLKSFISNIFSINNKDL